MTPAFSRSSRAVVVTARGTSGSRGKPRSKGYDQSTAEPVPELQSVTRESTTGSLDATADLAGAVDINFSSDTFDLNNLADTIQLDQIQGAAGMMRAAGPQCLPGIAATQPGQQARVTSEGVGDVARLASSDPGFAGEDFEGGAIRQGTEQFGELIDKVDIPDFVGGLIENVFQAIVTSTINQMRALAKMLISISQSVDDFARDNTAENNTRDWLSEFPSGFFRHLDLGRGRFRFRR